MSRPCSFLLVLARHLNAPLCRGADQPSAEADAEADRGAGPLGCLSEDPCVPGPLRAAPWGQRPGHSGPPGVSFRAGVNVQAAPGRLGSAAGLRSQASAQPHPPQLATTVSGVPGSLRNIWAMRMIRWTIGPRIIRIARNIHDLLIRPCTPGACWAGEAAPPGQRRCSWSPLAAGARNRQRLGTKKPDTRPGRGRAEAGHKERRRQRLGGGLVVHIICCCLLYLYVYYLWAVIIRHDDRVPGRPT
jgi:hypothetical protein